MNVACLLVLAVLAGPAASAEASAPVVDVSAQAEYDAIVAAIDAGALETAAARIASAALPIDAEDRLRGVLALRRGAHDDAVRHLEAALARSPADAALRLYLASAQLGRDDAKAALAALHGTDALGATVVAQPLLLARARMGTGDDAGAYAALEAASRRFPREVAPRLEAMVLCARQSLGAAAVAWAQDIVALQGDALDRDTTLAIVAAIGRERAALPLLEELAARSPEDAELRAHLAHAWSAHGHWYAAATLFESASGTAGTYAFEAADQYRLAGFASRALAHNARVDDAARRVDQRIDILFGAGEMARVVALQPEATRVGAMGSSTRMRLAHAHFLLGQHALAAALARTLLGSDEDDRARTLLRATGRARGDGADAGAEDVDASP